MNGSKNKGSAIRELALVPVPAESAATVVYGAPFQLTTGPGTPVRWKQFRSPVVPVSEVFTVIWLNVEKMLFRSTTSEPVPVASRA